MHRTGKHTNPDGTYPAAGPSPAQRPSHTTNPATQNLADSQNYESPTGSEGHQSEAQDRADETSPEASTSSRKKSKPVRSACNQCQRRKTRCSGGRPTCEFCKDRGLECSWEIGFGMTRAEDMRHKLALADAHHDDINTLVNDMRNNTDDIATTLLAKLRLGASVQDLAAGIRAGTSYTDDTIEYNSRTPESERGPYQFGRNRTTSHDHRGQTFEWNVPGSNPQGR